MKGFLHAFKKNPYPYLFTLVFCVGILLRFYRFFDFITFLGDQGRDAIVILRIIRFEHFPAVGPTSSVGNIFLGPFYYYFIAPWLLLTRFNPSGLAIGVGVFSCLYLYLNYIFVKDLIDKQTAFMSTVFLAFSSTIIEFSRFSWNPNLLPLFALCTAYFFIKAINTKKIAFFILAGLFVSFSIQLHYLALLIGIPMMIVSCVYFYHSRKDLVKTTLNLSSMAVGFFVGILPLLIFDLKHQFTNTKSIISFITSTHSHIADKVNDFRESALALIKFSFHVADPTLGMLFFIVFLVLLSLAAVKVKKNISAIMVIVFFVLILVGMSFYNGPKYVHYFESLYPFFYIMVALIITQLTKSYAKGIAIFAAIIVFISLNVGSYYFFTVGENGQIRTARAASQVIFDHIKTKNYSLTSLPQGYDDFVNRYFLELWGKPPIDKNSSLKTNQLFVTCSEACKPIGDPQWEIAIFAPTKVVESWRVNNVTIYELSR